MCGITGFFGRKTPDRQFLERMAAAIKHRGPDQTGVLVEEEVGLAMNRLSIIDLSGGNQPMHAPDHSFSLIFNGEIYNFRELRLELEKQCEFHTRSDTEVILHGYSVWGMKLFEKLNGMFSIAIWDRSVRKLVLARDAVGIKPLFFLIKDKVLYFSSELKSFTQTRIADRADWSAILAFLSAGYVFHPDSTLEGVKQVEPGTTLSVNLDLEVEVKSFRAIGTRSAKTPAFDPGRPAGPQVRRVLADAVERQTVADVPFGLLLSSGIDSMTILAALREKKLTDGLETFTVFYGESSFSENKAVTRLAREWNLVNHELELTSAQVESSLSDIFETFDNLELLPTCVAIHAVSHLAGKNCRVLLAGNGGDELFFGYPTHIATDLIQRYPLLGSAASSLGWLAKLLPSSDDYLTSVEKLQRFAASASRDPIASHLRWRHVFAYDDLKELLADFSAFPTSDQIYASQRKFFTEAQRRGFDEKDSLMIGDLRTWLIDCGLMMWDKAGMSASAEIRVPLLDNDFLDFIIPLSRSIRAPELGTKSFFKSLYSDSLPDYITRQPKQGFQTPVAQWLRGRLGETFEALTAELPADHFNRDYIAGLWRDFKSRKKDNSLRLWTLGCLAGWAKVHQINFAPLPDQS
jgi:asparagine synthase (glutamine-hydrolysing)